MALNEEIRNIYSKITSTSKIIQNIGKIDPLFLDPTDFKFNDLGFAVNNWVRLTNKDIKNFNFGQKTALAVKETVTERTNINVKTKKGGFNIGDKKLIDLLLFNVSLDISKRAENIKTTIKGLGEVTQIYDEGTFKITLRGTLFSPVTWQSDNDAIRDLRSLSELGTNLFIQNPEINKLYDISRVVLDKIEIRNNRSYSNLREFTIDLSEDISPKIFKINEE